VKSELPRKREILDVGIDGHMFDVADIAKLSRHRFAKACRLPIEFDRYHAGVLRKLFN
jgi:hypothetical protein